MFAKRAWQFATLLTVIALMLTACGNQPTMTEEPPAEQPAPQEPAAQAPAAVEPVEVQVCALLAIGPDQGWDQTFLQSFDRIVAAQPVEGIIVKELKYIEGLWGDEAEAAMREYAESGECDIIWPHGGYNDNVDNIKDDYPDIMFLEVGSGVLDYGGNNYHFWLRCHEASYAMGVLAGHMSKTNVFGGVGTYPASDVNDSLNSFFDGAQSVKGDIVQKVAFINSWYDPAAANEAASAQIAAGAQHIDMYAETFDACADGGVICYGAYNDYSETYPSTVLASFVVKWDSAIKWSLEEWVKAKSGAGFDAPESPEFTMSSDGSCDVKLSDTLQSKIPPEALEAFNSTREAILDGSLKVNFNDSLPGSDED
jgi:basic membrane lipoprotein Med (substrate-binding protein (PBP1-ABC) superfamily)